MATGIQESSTSSESSELQKYPEGYFSLKKVPQVMELREYKIWKLVDNQGASLSAWLPNSKTFTLSGVCEAVELNDRALEVVSQLKFEQRVQVEDDLIIQRVR